MFQMCEMRKNMKAKIGTNLFTGIRPTGALTVANYVGAVQPLLDVQEKESGIMVFVADLHALTDNEPSVAREYTKEVVADYIALGLDPKKVTIFVQSKIASEINMLTLFLARHISVAELLRVPTLKEKLKEKERPENANALLFLYPVMMAADILIQRAQGVPVGEDQVPHIEVTRKLAKRFNDAYGEIFPLPKAYAIKPVRILSLKGDGKMSKSSPEGAIFLTDTKESVEKKIQRAQTSVEGEMNEVLQSHFLLAQSLCSDEPKKQILEEMQKQHMNGTPIMGEFKKLFIEITLEFLETFQKKRAQLLLDTSFIDDLLEKGNTKARENAQETLDMIEKAVLRL